MERRPLTPKKMETSIMILFFLDGVTVGAIVTLLIMIKRDVHTEWAKPLPKNTNQKPDAYGPLQAPPPGGSKA